MRRVSSAVSALLSLAVLGAGIGAAIAAEPSKDDAALKSACEKLVTNPFEGSGPQEWSRPFQGIDPFRAMPVCSEALKRFPDDATLKLDLALAYLAGRKNEEATKLLDGLVSQGDSNAMLALAYISSKVGAITLMRRAAEAGNASGLMLYGMAQMSGNGTEKDVEGGVKSLRRAADAGSTRAMLILANFYYKGEYGLGFDPDEAKRLVTEAMNRGDPSAREALDHIKANEAYDAKKDR